MSFDYKITTFDQKDKKTVISFTIIDSWPNIGTSL